jgi:hypothetical protein
MSTLIDVFIVASDYDIEGPLTENVTERVARQLAVHRERRPDDMRTDAELAKSYRSSVCHAGPRLFLEAGYPGLSVATARAWEGVAWTRLMAESA